ncbi:MAG: hypothetical protein ACK44F_09760, partial [Roseococcus sp.]
MAIARLPAAPPLQPPPAARRWSRLRGVQASLARRKGLLLACLVLPPIAAGLASLTQPALHRAELLLRLSGPAREGAAGEATLLTSLAVAEAALAARPAPGISAARLAEGLRAEILAEGALIRLSLAAPEAAQAAALLEAVAQAWLATRVRLTEGGDLARWRAELAALEARREATLARLATPDLAREIAALAERRQALAERHAEAMAARE